MGECCGAVPGLALTEIKRSVNFENQPVDGASAGSCACGAVLECARLAARSFNVQTLLFTVLAVVLYLVADRVLDAAERRAGRRFEYRSLYFFLILLLLAVVSFALVRRFLPGA
jgi:predicted nucleic acid-binding Zn ribbon protein